MTQEELYAAKNERLLNQALERLTALEERVRVLEERLRALQIGNLGG